MKRVLIKSVHGAFGYIMEHYYPFGMADEAADQGALIDTYAVISIQDSHTQGFGIRFEENRFCKGVLTLYFDDIVKAVDGVVLFDDNMADRIIEFIEQYKDAVDTLLVHSPLICSAAAFSNMRQEILCLAQKKSGYDFA